MSPAEAAAAKLGTIDQVILDRLRAGVERVNDDGVTGREQHINLLFRAAFGVADADMPTNRFQQQRLGTYIKRLNEKLAPKERVVPGVARRTYRLEPVPVEG